MANQLRALERVARLKADKDLRAAGDLASRLTMANQELQHARQMLAQSYQCPLPVSLIEVRLVNLQASRFSQDLIEAQAEVDRLVPQYQTALRRAAIGLGKAEVMAEIGKRGSKGGR